MIEPGASREDSVRWAGTAVYCDDYTGSRCLLHAPGRSAGLVFMPVLYRRAGDYWIVRHRHGHKKVDTRAEAAAAAYSAWKQEATSNMGGARHTALTLVDVERELERAYD